MPAQSASPAIRVNRSGHRPPAAWPARTAGWIGAVVLVSGFALHAYWAAGGEWAAGPDFEPLLPPWAAVAQGAVLTLGAATLLLARIGAIPLSRPRWLLHAGPWVFSAVFAVAGLQSLLAMPAISGPDGQAAYWLSDVQGPLFLLLAVLCAVVGRADPEGRRAA